MFWLVDFEWDFKMVSWVQFMKILIKKMWTCCIMYVEESWLSDLIIAKENIEGLDCSNIKKWGTSWTKD